jgi:phage shock protein PspC (stress-responsive transcriptional regulator)
MKRTYTINISGTIFHIEEDAYEALQKYLINLKKHFGEDDEGREILSDIEARIAEIFTDKMSDSQNVITILWVEEVIKTMGTPKDFAEEAGEEDEIFTGPDKRKRRFYRDPDNRVFGGVCSGLGAYFQMDPVILRIIFVVLFFITTGGALLAYIILWIAVPKAKTTAQRLEMRGQEATIKNIEKSIREEVKDVKESYKKFKKSDSYAKGKKSLEGAGEVTYNIFKLLLKVAVLVIGIAFIISGFIGLLGLISSLALGHSFVHGWPLIWTPDIHFPAFFDYFLEPGTVTAGIIAIGFIGGMPLLAILFIGSKIVFRYKSNNTAIGLSMVGIWLIALIFLVVLSAGQVGNYKSRSSVVTSRAIQCDTCITLYLNLAEVNYETYSEEDWNINNFKVLSVNGEEVLAGEPRLDVERASGDRFLIAIKKMSRGRTREDARELAEDIIYNYQEIDSTIFFDPYFLLDENRKWRDQEVHITVKVPEGKAVYLEDNMIDIIYDIENVSNTWDGDMVGKTWKMKPEGLALKESSE